jgi:hypothetical protein
VIAINSNLALEALAPLAIAAVGFAALARGFGAVGGTTLRAPWWWAAGSLAAIAGSEAAVAILGVDQTAGAAQLRLAASTTTFLPLVALLGAKRPQDRAWQFILLAFWVMLALPAGQAWLLRPDSPPAMHGLWTGFMLLLAVIGCTNYLPTRFWPAAVLAAAGQIVLHWRYLPLIGVTQSEDLSLWGLGLLTAALIVATAIGRQGRTRGDPLDRIWIDFRDQYGVVWGLRVAERVNASAKMHGWDVALGWHGFATNGGGSVEVIPADVRAGIEAVLRTVLRRFVSAEWIDRRLAASGPIDSFLAGPTGVSHGTER